MVNIKGEELRSEALDRGGIRQRLDSMSLAWRKRIDQWRDTGQTHTEKWSLEKHYAPLGMSQQLVKAHDALDSIVDKALGAPRRCRDERERQHYLFESYAILTQ